MENFIFEYKKGQLFDEDLYLISGAAPKTIFIKPLLEYTETTLIKHSIMRTNSLNLILIKKTTIRHSSNGGYEISNENYCFTIVFPAKITVPVLAKALPSKVAPVSKVMDCIAIIVPLNTEVVPKVAELPTCQNILAA